jgi:cysteine desulfurase
MKLPIYLDYSATTPVDPRVAAKMIPYLTEDFGNPASRSHPFGWTAEKAVEEAREQVAKLVNCEAKELVWTSGATESINLALKGAANFYKSRGKHLITIKTEHKATLDTMRELERQGFEVTYLDVQPNGLIDLAVLKAALRPDTIVVSVMFVNNEIGVIQDIPAIGEMCRAGIAGDGKNPIIFHVDAAQATGKVVVDLQAPDMWKGRPDELLGAQDVRAEGHGRALHPPQAPRAARGADARRRPRARIPLGHAADAPDRRHGRSVRLAREEMAAENERIRMLRDRLWAGLSEMEEVYLNGDMDQRVPHNLNVSFNFVEGESLIMAIKDIAVSSGSACTSASLEPSYVLRALGRNDELAHSSIRFTVGRFTTEEDIDYAIRLIHGKIEKLREAVPAVGDVQGRRGLEYRAMGSTLIL